MFNDPLSDAHRRYDELYGDDDDDDCYYYTAEDAADDYYTAQCEERER